MTSLFIPFKTSEEKAEAIKNNTIKMLSNRVYLDDKGNKHPLMDYEKVLKNVVEDKNNCLYQMKSNNGYDYVLKIYFRKISKAIDIENLMKEYPNAIKIVVAENYGANIEKIIVADGSQIFEMNKLLHDIISNHYQPDFEIMTPNEVAQMKTEYHVNDYTAQKMLRTDPVAKYFGLKKGQYLKITRYSPIAGRNVTYRMVV